MTLTRVQAPILPGSLLLAAGRGSACPTSAGVWLDTPLHLYMFVLLLCNFLNQVLPRSMPVCSGQGMRLLVGAGRVSACALWSAGSSAMRLSSLGLSGQGGEQAVSTCPIPTQRAELARGLQPNSNGRAGQLVSHHPYVPPTSTTIQRCATLGWTPSDCSLRYLCTLCYAFYFLPSSTLTSLNITRTQPEPSLPQLLRARQPGPVQNQAQPFNQEWLQQQVGKQHSSAWLQTPCRTNPLHPTRL